MAKLPILSNTLNTIDQHIEQSQSDWMRNHCGASGIGRPCERQIYYSFRWTSKPDFDGRVLRLFRRGQDEEPVIVKDLRAIGVEVSEGPAPGEQWRFKEIDGHFGGSMDGAALGLIEAPKTWHVLEFKTHNRKSFDDLQKHGVEKSKPEHFCQMMVYMHLSKMRRACYIAVCKDTDRRHLERIEYDAIFAGELMEKAKRIIYAQEPPRRISERPDYYLCKWCDHYEVCHQGGTPERNCRTCAMSEPVKNGMWKCGSNGALLNGDAQRAGCADYRGIE